MIPFNTCMLDFTWGTMQGVRKYESKPVHSDWKDCLDFSVGILHTLFHKPLKPTFPLFVATSPFLAVQFCDICYMRWFFPWQEYIFSNPKANLISPALSLGLSNDYILFRILLFSRGLFLDNIWVCFVWTLDCHNVQDNSGPSTRPFIRVNPWEISLSAGTFQINKPFPKAFLSTE